MASYYLCRVYVDVDNEFGDEEINIDWDFTICNVDEKEGWAYCEINKELLPVHPMKGYWTYVDNYYNIDGILQTLKIDDPDIEDLKYVKKLLLHDDFFIDNLSEIPRDAIENIVDVKCQTFGNITKQLKRKVSKKLK